MKWKWTIAILAALLVAAFALPPTVNWQGRREYTLTLSELAAADTRNLYYHKQWDPAEGESLCEVYRTESPQDINPSFQQVSVAPDRTFTIQVPSHGTSSFWGLRRKRQTCEHVILMSEKRNGRRSFICVSVKSTEPIDLK